MANDHPLLATEPRRIHLAAGEITYDAGSGDYYITAGLKTRTYLPNLTPVVVPNNSESIQSFAVPGLTVNDTVYVNPPALTTTVFPTACNVSAPDTLDILFVNHAGMGPATPPAGIYRVVAIAV